MKQFFNSKMSSTPRGRMHQMQRIIVCGMPGAGKSTLSRQISQKLGLSLISIDTFLFEANWTRVTEEVICERIMQTINNGSWIVDGDPDETRDIVWSAADTLIWLDYPLLLIFWRLLKRLVWRWIRHEELWNGNYERLGHQLFSSSSIFRIVLRDYWHHHEQYYEYFSLYPHLNILRLHSHKEAHHWLDGLLSQ